MIMRRTEPERQIARLLSDQGPIAETLGQYEVRSQQMDMAAAVYRAFNLSRHLVAEAGTGVGKSFAYLVPAIEYLFEQSGKALISTYTINLQEQLIQKDLPILDTCLDKGFIARLAKGRGNYVCKRRLAFSLARMDRLLGGFAEQLRGIDAWAAQTKDGSLSDLGFVPRANVWDKVKSEHGNCQGRKCRHHEHCFYWKARRELESADIIVANHALLFSDLVLKKEDYALLPNYNVVVLDEAHTIERIAEDHFGLNISHRRVSYVLDGLYHPRRRKGLLMDARDTDAINLVCEAHLQARSFFDSVNAWYQKNRKQSQGKCPPHVVDNTLTPVLKDLRRQLRQQIKKAQDKDEQLELTRYTDMCHAVAEELSDFISQTHEDHIHWVESGSIDFSDVRLKSAPLNIGPYMQQSLFEPHDAVVLTSATLSTAGQEGHSRGGFEFFCGRIGLTEYDSVKLGSPFDYEQQVTVYVESTLPEPSHETFVEEAAHAVKKYLLKTEGRAFILFTSYRMLEEMAEMLEPWLRSEGFTLLQQGAQVDRTTLLHRFKEDEKHVLFGTDSFWQGVDVPGDTLSNVIIVKLPFAVPDHPLLAGRLQEIKKQGGNPFFDYQLPSAIIKFKQGFGRLIRTKTDQGIVVILDSRVAHKRYGRHFLESIPRCRLEIVE